MNVSNMLPIAKQKALMQLYINVLIFIFGSPSSKHIISKCYFSMCKT